MASLMAGREPLLVNSEVLKRLQVIAHLFSAGTSPLNQFMS